MAKLVPGETIKPFAVTDMRGNKVQVPGAEQSLTHLQFRRFAGCPICNLHLRLVVQRRDEINAAGIQEIVFFHSDAEALREHESHLPLPVIPDAERKWYREFGVETSLAGLFHPKTVAAAFSGLSFKNLLPALSPKEEHTGLPADFLLDQKGKVLAAKYGTHASDQWTVDEILELARQHR